MCKRYQILLVLQVIVYLLLTSGLCFGEDSIGVEKAGISPWGEVKLQYDDNIFLDSNNEKDDFILTISPGITAKCPFGSNLFRFDYHIDVIEFFEYSSQDAKNHYLSGEIDINWKDIGFVVYDRFEHVFERPSTEDTSRVKRDDNRTGLKAKLQRERLGIELGYEHFIRNYKSDETYEPFDRKEDLYSFILTHKTFPKTDLLFEYDFCQVRYDESLHPDSDYHQFLIGAIGELTRKTLVTIKTGYQYRDYRRSDEENFETGVLYADMSYRISQKDALKVSFLRSANESTYSTNNFYRIENVSATLSHSFNNKLLGFLTSAYQINSYPEESTEGSETKKRKDRYYSMGTGLKYFVRKWLSMSLRFDHIIRDSNFDVFEYNQNLITFIVRAEF